MPLDTSLFDASKALLNNLVGCSETSCDWGHAAVVPARPTPWPEQCAALAVWHDPPTMHEHSRCNTVWRVRYHVAVSTCALDTPDRVQVAAWDHSSRVASLLRCLTCRDAGCDGLFWSHVWPWARVMPELAVSATTWSQGRATTTISFDDFGWCGGCADDEPASSPPC